MLPRRILAGIVETGLAMDPAQVGKAPAAAPLQVPDGGLPR